MSIRLDAAADRLLRTAGLLSPNTPYTWMAWLRWSSIAKSYAKASSAADILDAIGISAAGAVEATAAAAGGGGSSTYQVAASADDAHMDSITDNSGRAPTNNGIVSLTNTKLEAGSHGGNAEWCVAIRFPGIAAAQGATISSATLELRGNASYNAAPNVVKFFVSAQASDNAPALATTNGDLNSTTRPRSTAYAEWTQTNVVGGSWYSVDVTAVIQEIVNRAGWATGNAIVMLVDVHPDCTTGEWQDFDSYDGAPAGAPKLTIALSGGGAPSVVSGGSVSVDTWVHLCLVRESVTSLKAYLDGTLVATHTADATGRSAVTRQEMGGQSASNNGPLNGRIALAKMWSAALTPAEIALERETARPCRFTDLWNWAPLMLATELVDYGGNARDWTAGGTLTTEDGPPVHWGA